MNRIKRFEFFWADAWGVVIYGYNLSSEISDNNDIIIKVSLNKHKQKIVLNSQKENEFIDDMNFIINWNDKMYSNPFVLDGTMWHLIFDYDDVHVVSSGGNGYPSDFVKFLELLHQKYKVPKAEIEDIQEIKNFTKETKITPLNKYRSI